MQFSAQQFSYRHTAAFSTIVLDYVEGAPQLLPFYAQAPSESGVGQALEAKRKSPQHRAVLVQALHEQYTAVEADEAVSAHIDLLLHPDTFTVCTAHQPNLFSGPLYVIYKILHAIKLASHLNNVIPGCRFVPVYYMGSEDADKEELLHTFVAGKKYEWQTAQTGAVGRMQVDGDLKKLIDELAAQISVAPAGQEFMQLLNRCYTEGQTVQVATFALVHALFKKYGLVVLIPDNGDLKKLMQPVFEDELFHQTSSAIVEETGAALGAQYKVQANPRAINLFYLTDGIRNRIVKTNTGFAVHDTDIEFTEASIKEELSAHPERFSPNVILRGLFQETVLPNVAFIGGGGELAYWLQLRKLFEHHAVPFPVLVLRNSFLIVDEKQRQRLQKWNLPLAEIFGSELQILNALLQNGGKLPALNGEAGKLVSVYEDLKKLAAGVDSSLLQHVDALETKSLAQLRQLEKKLARAERKKHETLQRQVAQLKEALFPKNNLQERVENLSSFYAKWGSGLLDELLRHSLCFEQRFTILTES